ncbi:MAG: HEAT repeat domain-containing protein [Caldilineaceae bacterium]
MYPLLATIDDSDATLRLHIVHALGRITAKSVFRYDSLTAMNSTAESQVLDALIKRLHDPILEVRSEAVTALGLIGNKRAAENLVSAFDNNENETLTQSIAQALVQVGDVRGINIHLEKLPPDIRNDEDAWRKLKKEYAQFGGDALESLLAFIRNLCWIEENLMTDDDFESYKNNRLSIVLKLVEQIGKSAIEPLFEVLMNSEEPVRMRAFALSAIGAIEREYFITIHIPLICSFLSDSNELIQLVAAEVLGWLEDSRSIMPLITAIRTSTGELRRVIWDNLSKIPGQPSSPILLELLSDQDPDCRAYAARNIAYYRDEQAITPLRALLNDPIPVVRSQAAWPLIQMGYFHVAENLISSIALEIDKVYENNEAESIADSLSTYGQKVIMPMLDYLRNTSE